MVNPSKLTKKQNVLKKINDGKVSTRTKKSARLTPKIAAERRKKRKEEAELINLSSRMNLLRFLQIDAKFKSKDFNRPRSVKNCRKEHSNKLIEPASFTIQRQLGSVDQLVNMLYNNKI